MAESYFTNKERTMIYQVIPLREIFCECENPSCPCGGGCQADATVVLHRIGVLGTCVAFCDRCSADALESGVLALDTYNDDDDEVYILVSRKARARKLG